MKHYETARELYEELLGPDHSSTLTTLTNIGLMMRLLAERSKGLEKTDLLDRWPLLLWFCAPFLERGFFSQFRTVFTTCSVYSATGRAREGLVTVCWHGSLGSYNEGAG